MKNSGQTAQTLVFFLVAFGTIILLCGFAIDSGLLYLAKARLSRAVDGAALAAVGNFHQSDDPTTNRILVSTTMRNFAAANYSDLRSISTTATETASGTTPIVYTYNFNDGTTDSSGNYRRYVQVVLQTGAGGQITSATCNARCPSRTYFMGYAGPFFRDMKVSSAAVATRNPRLIMVVVDRSGSMLSSPGGGAYGLPDAIVTFLNFFDTSSDYIGLVSFSSNARLEMPLTTNFLNAGTNVLYNSYDPTNHVPGVDFEQSDPNYATTGVRRMKFGGETSADEGMRLGIEQMMANPGFNNPNVTKYLVLFTDGAWNNVRTLLAAPGYTNVVTVPAGTNYDVTPYPVPTLSPYANYTNAIANTVFDPNDHTSDYWQSLDGGAYEPLSGSSSMVPGHTAAVTNTSYLGTNSSGVGLYATNLNVWLQPGSVDYVLDPIGNVVGTPYVSCYTNAITNVSIYVPPGDSSMLVVPGYVVDGTFTDEMDLPYPDNGVNFQYLVDNFNEPYMWPDDTQPGNPSPYVTISNMRNLMFRNYANLLTGLYIYRPDDPYGSGVEPLVKTADYPSGYPRPLNGLGPYYPGAAFYWPVDLMGINVRDTFSLRDPLSGQPSEARHIAYSINMLSDAAAPRWAGELFYKSTSGSGVISGTSSTSVSTQIQSASDWQLGEPSWFSVFSADMLTDPSHYGTGSTNIINGTVWRPATFKGSPISGLGAVTPGGSATGGYVTDGAGNYYNNSMAYSGRPTHYYDFSNSTWKPINNNHIYPANIALPLGNWKVQEYAWHARDKGVTIYTVGYGSLVNDAEQVILAQVANATNTTGYGSGTNVPITFNPNQPIGQQFLANDTNQIIADFQSIAQAINAALTQ
jgi:Flp pilus assembly protein TadG